MTLDEIRFVENITVARETGLSWDRLVGLVIQTWGKEDPGGAARLLAEHEGEDRPLSVAGCRLPENASGIRGPGVKLSGSVARPVSVHDARGLAVSLLMHADLSETLMAVEDYLAKARDQEMGRKILKGITAHVVKVRNEGLASWLKGLFPASPDGPPLVQSSPGHPSPEQPVQENPADDSGDDQG